MAKRTILQSILFGAGQILNEELQARKKAREEASKKPPDEAEPQAAPEDPTSAERDEATAAPPESGEAAPEGASAEAPAEGTTSAPPPTADASCATDLGASVMDPPRCDTWNFSGAADAGASIDGGEAPADDAQSVQAEAHRADVDTRSDDPQRDRRRGWRGHLRRRRRAVPSMSRATSDQETPPGVDDLRAVVQQLLGTVEALRAEVAARREQPAAAEADAAPESLDREDTTPGVVEIESTPRAPADKPDVPRDVDEEVPAGRDAAPSRKQPPAHRRSEPPEEDELPPPPDWYVNTPLVRKEEWTHEGVDDYWDEGEQPIVDDEIDYRLIEEYDPRDDPDMERVA